MKIDAISKRLMRAYNRLQDPKRWIKGSLTDWADGDDGLTITQHCLLGAIGITDASGKVTKYSTRYFVIEAIKELFPKRYKKALLREADGGEAWNIANSPAFFNDMDQTKHADVLAVIRRAIELSEAHFKNKQAPKIPDGLIAVVKTQSPWYKQA